ncbi:Reverse transcriptase domain [Trinorchestia longiramus]|nr:Reverse transcriptase domain [Trinorchestia longiramus]
MEELNSSLSTLKNKAPGQDGVYDRFLQKLPLHWKKELLCVYNTSLYTGCVPPGWKWGIWLPILKPGKDPEQISSYRLTCLLSCIGMLMERMIQRRLEHWVETNNLLLGEQVGFWKGKSTMDSLLIAEDFIANTFSRKQICIAVYLDLDGAYDSVWHEGIIYKLIASGLEITYLKWLKNYLTGQTAFVRLGAVQSEGVPVTWGLPQGAVLSPLLFNIMLSDLPVADGVQLIIYANDITILSKGDSNRSESLPSKRVLGIVFDAPRLTFAAHIGNLVGDLHKKVTSAASPVSGTLGCISRASLTGVYSIYQKQARVRMACLGNATVKQPQKTCCNSKYGVTQHIGSEKNQPSFVPGGGVKDTPTGAVAPIADSSLVYPSHE